MTCFSLTLLGFIIAVKETSKNSQVSHFSKAHHITGLVMMILLTFQVMLGFARPPVKKSKGGRKKKEEKDPSSPRAIWRSLHSSIGLSLMILSIYQTFLGLTLFNK